MEKPVIFRFAALLTALLLVLPLSVSALEIPQYRSQLTVSEAGLYDALLAGFLKHADEISYSLVVPEPVSDSDRAAAAAKKLVLRAYEALYRDHPEVFWIGKEPLSYTPTIKTDGEKLLLSVDVAMSFPVLPTELAAARAALEKTVGAILSRASGTDAEKISTFHRALVEGCAYDQAAVVDPSSHPLAYEAYGALVEHKATCEGYSKALKLLCDRAGIPSVIIGGTAGKTDHMWNYVKVGELYYLVDVTFDDPVGGKPVTDYLLKGQSALKDHTASKGFLRNYDTGLVDPILASSDYIWGTQTAASVQASLPPPKAADYRIDFTTPEHGRLSVKYIGIAGALDNGQKVLSGLVLEASVLPDPGYELAALTVQMGASTLTEGEKSVLRFSVSAPCRVSAEFRERN